MAERRLWAELRKLKLNIRRQAPIGPYIADFAHHSSRLVIEVDGYFHTLEGRPERDAKRDDWLKSQGYRVLRIAEYDAREKTVEIAERIGVYIGKLLARSAPFPLEGGRVGDGGAAPASPENSPTTLNGANSRSSCEHPHPHPSPLKGEGLSKPHRPVGSNGKGGPS